MSILQALILGFVQGATEFIPVPARPPGAVPWLLGWPSPSLVFDTMVHWGTLIAVVGYFWRDWRAADHRLAARLEALGLARSPGRLAWLLVIGTLPAAVIGYLLEDWFESLFSEPVWVSSFCWSRPAYWSSASVWPPKLCGGGDRHIDSLQWPHALVIGFAQAAAIAPGISARGRR